MPVDTLLVKQRLAFIRNCVAHLERLALLPKDEFLNGDNPASAESYLRRSLEAVFDIGRHILAKNGGMDIALEYKGIAEGLGRMGIVPKALQESLAKMAGYRNRLVHLYHLVSNEELYEVISTNLAHIKQFEQAILEYVYGKRTT
jgi:uncharacterized protein YutE (UPF0331/DUF86 family)